MVMNQQNGGADAWTPADIQRAEKVSVQMKTCLANERDGERHEGFHVAALLPETI